ncbi:MAG TPA: DUF1109 domain-containing protein [Accumulibacter sp.]|uniref:DUF1109 domain-containing protein n=1 Tax=Accumulibacter sp. TaxID=2053492 RepID=UPI002CB5BC3D|nr:DUF1109 domain-containing protein [Accumulibacter sp.]HMX69544.1 DUF1109 domain-containing protein [Accumulibacter sp.]HNI52324.1 DUF1109 domain-containing protein [Accumulibacter sp.]HNN84988.1 DUF1109 domain-containing protein [Accumulibacter sp.]
MKTDELVRLLATGADAVDTHAAERRIAGAVGYGAVGALLLMLALLGVRADLEQAVSSPSFWLKTGFVAGVLAASAFTAWRLARPGARLAGVPAALAAPLVVIWAFAAYAVLGADPAQRADLVLGATWRWCPWLIALLSLPAFVAAVHAMQGLAPTRPRLAGAAAGLLAGATGALVYCLHCPESAPPFIGLWYVVGMLVPALAGAALGERLLRW